MPSNDIHQPNGTLNGEVPIPCVSTQPEPNRSWQITLANKVLAITGANRGIGLGIAEVCLANSAKVVYSLDLMEPGEDFAALQKKYPNFKYIQTDVTDDESIENAVNTIVLEQKAIHGFVANAGMTKHQPALKFSRKEVEKLFKLNVSSHIHDSHGWLRVSGLWGIFMCTNCRQKIH
jgi:NAD(P)-dependent dehydrogenase (short-subunit alcohol dehydrogenase family)